MSRLTRDATTEPVLRDQILRRADPKQHSQPHPVDPYSAICDDHTHIHTYIHTYINIRGVDGNASHGINETQRKCVSRVCVSRSVNSTWNKSIHAPSQGTMSPSTNG